MAETGIAGPRDVSLINYQEAERVEAAWARIVSKAEAVITVAGPPDAPVVTVRVRVVHDPAAVRDAAGAFGSLTEAVTIPANAAATNVAGAGVRWEKIPDYGRVDAAMSVYPVTAASVVPGAGAPCLEYPVYLPKAGELTVDAVIAPTLAFVPNRGLRLAVSIDDAAPQTADAAMTVMGRDGVWRDAVSNGVRVLSFGARVATPGRHTLKVRRVDPGVVLQQLVLQPALGRPGYFGPPAASPGVAP